MGGDNVMTTSVDNSLEMLLKGVQGEMWGSKKNFCSSFGSRNTACSCADRHDPRERGQKLGGIFKQEWEDEIQGII